MNTPKNDKTIISREPISGSKKIYISGKLHTIKVPMREITLTDTITKNTFDTERIPNHPVTVYDTSGAYTDPAIDIDLKKD